MKLDRSTSGDGRGKYGLILNRKLSDNVVGRETVLAAIRTLEEAGIIDWGTTPDTEFFVMRLRDRYAGAAIATYARLAMNDDPEYGTEVAHLSTRAGNMHPSVKVPD